MTAYRVFLSCLGGISMSLVWVIFSIFCGYLSRWGGLGKNLLLKSVACTLGYLVCGAIVVLLLVFFLKETYPFDDLEVIAFCLFFMGPFILFWRMGWLKIPKWK